MALLPVHAQAFGELFKGPLSVGQFDRHVFNLNRLVTANNPPRHLHLLDVPRVEASLPKLLQCDLAVQHVFGVGDVCPKRRVGHGFQHRHARHASVI